MTGKLPVYFQCFLISLRFLLRRISLTSSPSASSAYPYPFSLSVRASYGQCLSSWPPSSSSSSRSSLSPCRFPPVKNIRVLRVQKPPYRPHCCESRYDPASQSRTDTKAHTNSLPRRSRAALNHQGGKREGSSLPLDLRPHPLALIGDFGDQPFKYVALNKSLPRFRRPHWVHSPCSYP